MDEFPVDDTVGVGAEAKMGGITVDGLRQLRKGERQGLVLVFQQWAHIHCVRIGDMCQDAFSELVKNPGSKLSSAVSWFHRRDPGHDGDMSSEEGVAWWHRLAGRVPRVEFEGQLTIRDDLGDGDEEGLAISVGDDSHPSSLLVVVLRDKLLSSRSGCDEKGRLLHCDEAILIPEGVGKEGVGALRSWRHLEVKLDSGRHQILVMNIKHVGGAMSEHVPVVNERYPHWGDDIQWGVIPEFFVVVLDGLRMDCACFSDERVGPSWFKACLEGHWVIGHEVVGSLYN